MKRHENKNEGEIEAPNFHGGQSNISMVSNYGNQVPAEEIPSVS